MTFFRITAAAWLVASLSFFGLASHASAQIGTGWNGVTYVKYLHLDDETGLHQYAYSSNRIVGQNTACARFHYLDDNDGEYFEIFDSRSNRCEVRVSNTYTTGNRQFQGYVRISAPLDSLTVFQIFGSDTSAAQTAIRGYSAGGGTLESSNPAAATLATGCYGVQVRINVIHYQGDRIEYYANGSFKSSGADTYGGSNYWKYGVYGSLGSSGPVQVLWRQVRFFNK